VTWTYHRGGYLHQWAVEDETGRHICLVFREEDAKALCAASALAERMEALATEIDGWARYPNNVPPEEFARRLRELLGEGR
jgi:hypothetical protein